MPPVTIRPSSVAAYCDQPNRNDGAVMPKLHYCTILGVKLPRLFRSRERRLIYCVITTISYLFAWCDRKLHITKTCFLDIWLAVLNENTSLVLSIYLLKVIMVI